MLFSQHPLELHNLNITPSWFTAISYCYNIFTIMCLSNLWLFTSSLEQGACFTDAIASAVIAIRISQHVCLCGELTTISTCSWPHTHKHIQVYIQVYIDIGRSWQPPPQPLSLPVIPHVMIEAIIGVLCHAIGLRLSHPWLDALCYFLFQIIIVMNL